MCHGIIKIRLSRKISNHRLNKDIIFLARTADIYVYSSEFHLLYR